MTRSTIPSVYLLCGECGRSTAWKRWECYDAEGLQWLPVHDLLRAKMLKCPSCGEVHSRIPEDSGVWGLGTYDEMDAERRRLERAMLARWVNYYPDRRKRGRQPRFVVSMQGDSAAKQRLTFKQRQVLALYALGFGRRQIRGNLDLLHRTLSSREKALMDNLGVNTVRDAVAAGRRRGIVA